MIKKIILNIVILLIFCASPLYYQFLHQDDLGDFRFRQNTVMSIVFLCFVTFTFLNHKYRKQAVDKKWVWLVFEIIGIIGLVYSGGILWLLYEFRNGIGF
jgi:EamA domain-containing membrane protein RarD